MLRPLVLLRSASLIALVLVTVTSAGVGGCMFDSAARKEEKAREAREAARNARPSHVQQAVYEDDGAAGEMTVTGEEGTLNESDIENAMREHWGEIRECLHAGHHARAGARAVLRFFVDARGEVQDVAIVESTIGDHAVERCLADIGLGVTFERPAGGKATTFDYPVELRPRPALTASRQHRP
jgi:hypothetical protein